MPNSPSTPAKALLTAWLLLGLRDRGERHGWGLVSELRRAGVPVEPGRAYRILRSLEDGGALQSRWTAPVNGPRRRAYRITRAGRRRLHELAAGVTAVWQLDDAFVRAYERAQTQRDTSADGRAPLAPDDLDDRAAATEFAQPQAVANEPGGPAPHASDAPAAQGTPGHDAPGHAHPTRELLAAWLLLLIDDHASYGYDLRRALSDHGVHTDPATLYRVLRKLDDTGWLDARWMAPDRGPRRRLYRLTARGRRNLSDVARIIGATRDTHAGFLDAYDGRVATQQARERRAAS